MKRLLGALGLSLLFVACQEDETTTEGSAGKSSVAGGGAASEDGGAPTRGGTSAVGGVPDEPADTEPKQLARNAYLASRLELQRSAAELPALAAALVVDGEIVARSVVGVRKWGEDAPAELGDYFMLKSSTKPMTGYLAARLMQEGLTVPATKAPFAFETTILDVFPELADIIQPAYEGTTVAQLMSHTSGMPYKPNTEGTDEFSSITSDLMERRFEYVKAAVIDEPENPSPYGGGSIIVAAMLERLTGKSWESLMQTYVYDELGMINSGVGESPYPESSHGVTSHTASGAGPVPWTPPDTYEEEPHAPAGRNPHASIGDFARFAAAQLSGANTRAGKLGKELLLASQQRVGDSDASQGGWAIGKYGTADGTADYLWHNGADGKDTSMIQVFPELNVAFAVMTNFENDEPIAIVTQELMGLALHLDMASGFSAAAATPKEATATNVIDDRTGFEADKAVDGSLVTRWATGNVAAAALTIDLGEARTISRVRIAEEEEYQRVRAFTISVPSAESPDEWRVVAEGTTIGTSLLVTFDEVEAALVKLDITDSTGGPTLTEVWID